MSCQPHQVTSGQGDKTTVRKQSNDEKGKQTYSVSVVVLFNASSVWNNVDVGMTVTCSKIDVT